MKGTGIIGLCVFLLIGCESSNTNSSLPGVWQTESCQQATDSNGQPVNIWAKGIYDFTSQGTIRIGHKSYTDSNCSLLSTSQEPTEFPVTVTFQDKGQLILQEGINGSSLYIEMHTPGQMQSFDGFYTINSGSLCFSEAFRFEVFTFAVVPFDVVDINFNNCLTRP